MPRRILILIGVAAVLALCAFVLWRLSTPAGATITGVVADAAGPVTGATVRVQATVNATVTDATGRFSLNVTPGLTVTISAWKAGYYCASAPGVMSPAHDVTLTLRTVQTGDNADYVWILPVGNNSCASCKPGVTELWLKDAHSGSARNLRFLTMYNGTDVHGNQSPPTRYVDSRDYGSRPLPPDPMLPYYGPGYKLDLPATAGNCAACHVPGAAVDAPYGVDPNTAAGADAFGVHCDFCHKVAAVKLDADTGLPRSNMPGTLSLDIRRPFPDDPERYQLFFGPFDDDNVPLEDTYLPLLQQSQFCAACHYGLFWDTLVYNSYGEWLASPYSDPRTGKTCQACHMGAPSVLNGQVLTNVAPGMGGVERDASTLSAHTHPAMTEPDLLQNAVTMTATAGLERGGLVVTVTLANDRTGHHVPSDSPLRHLILLVQVTDAGGQALAQVEGPAVPEWGGVGDPMLGYYAGLPGKAYAKVLGEVWTGITPTGAYWNPTRIVSDNRLAAFATDMSTYTFAAPSAGTVNVYVRLLYRRAYKALMDQKGWDAPDIVMEEALLAAPVTTPASGPGS